VCQVCAQVTGLPLGIRATSPGRRLGSALLDGLLFIVTAVIGWLVWAFFTSTHGQSPAKSILGLRVVKLADGRAATRGQMFVRWLFKRVLALITIAWVIAALWILWDPNRQALWDKMAETIVVDDPTGLVLRALPQAGIPARPSSAPVVPPPPPP
jgi:uncharacterized RDD family membrane protein YckC